MEKQPITKRMAISALKSLQKSGNVEVFPSTKNPGKFFFTCGSAKQAVANKLLPPDADVEDKDGNELNFTGYVSSKAIEAMEANQMDRISFGIVGSVPTLMAGNAPKFTL